MRIATFNIHHGTGADGGPGTPDEITTACRSLDADVLGLQEVDRGVARSGTVDQAALIAEAIGGNYTFVPSVSLDGGDYGNALVVRGTLTDVVHLRLAHRFRSEPRTTILARVEVDGFSGTVCVTHLATERDLARHQLLEVMDALSARPRPHALLADVNLPPAHVLPITTAEGMALVPTGPTHPADVPTAAIDVVGLTAELDPGDVDVRQTAISDHRAVVVDVAMSPTREQAR